MAEAAQADTSEYGNANPWLIAILVSVATFMEVLDTTIANVALRYIAGGLAVFRLPNAGRASRCTASPSWWRPSSGRHSAAGSATTCHGTGAFLSTCRSASSR